MRVNKDEYLTRAFVLTAVDLTKLEEAIEAFSPIRSIKIGCSDKLDREFSSVADLLTFENPPSKAIKSIRFFTRSPEVTTSLILRIDSDEFRNVYFSIEGEEEGVLNFLDSLDDRLSGMRPWYGMALEGLFRGLVVILIITYLLYALLSKGIVRLFMAMPFVPQTFTGYKQIIVASIPFVLLGVTVPIIVFKLKAYAFPTGVFAIGQGANRHKNREVVRTLAIVGLIINLAAGAIVWMMTAH